LQLLYFRGEKTMALTNWKAFPFFQVSQVPVPADEDGTYVFDVRIDFPMDIAPKSLTV